MKQIVIQVLLIVAIIAIMFVAYIFRSYLGLTGAESLGAISQIVTLAIFFICFNLIANFIFKTRTDQTDMAINIACAALSALLIFIFHNQIEKDWLKVFSMFFSAPNGGL